MQYKVDSCSVRELRPHHDHLCSAPAAPNHYVNNYVYHYVNWVVDQNYTINARGYLSTVDQHLEKPPTTSTDYTDGYEEVEYIDLWLENYAYIC